MKSRCLNKDHPRYNDYGGRGITVCDEWHKFEPFSQYILCLPGCPLGMQIPGAKPLKQIDRIRNNEGYKPGNIKWSNRTEQANNRRSSFMVTFKGKTLTLAQAVAQYATVPYKTVLARIKNGWDVKKQ